MTWKIYKAAHDTCKADVKLWANCENFDGAITTETLGGLLSPKITEHTSNQTATLDRFARQMEIASRYAENIITFSYNHYYSPSYVNPAFIEVYYDYLENGYRVEAEAPEAPSELRVEATEEGNVLTWDEAKDNIGIAYYRIEKDGKFLARIDMRYGWEELSFTDTGAAGKYVITAYDCAGNASPSVAF